MSNKNWKYFWRLVRIALMAFLLLLLMILAYGYFIGSRQFVVNHQTYYFHDLPEEFDGYRILQFSDLHLGTFRHGHQQDVDSIVALINRQHCDAIMFAGDLICKSSEELAPYDSLLSQLRAPDGVYSIIGNHDYGTYNEFEYEVDRLIDVEALQEHEASYGWRLLLNDHVILHRANQRIAIVGVENDGIPPFPQLANLDKAMKDIKTDDFCVLLTHDPTHWKRSIVNQTSIQLTLSGHTHAGQFKVFGWSPCSLRYPEWSGTYTEGEQILSVSDGIGNSIIPFRFGAWPEVNVITLRRITP